MSQLMKPTPLGDIMTYTFFAMGGVFVGGEAGLLSGTWSARRAIEGDVEAKGRIERAWRGFRADVLRRQVEELESGREKSIWS
jgi:hypothetical protein